MAALAAALACAPAPDAADLRMPARIDVALAGETMGSTWHIKICVPEGAERDARAMQGPIEELLEQVNEQMSTYRPDSEISRFNAHASTEPFSISHGFATVVAKAIEVGVATDGAYDITIDPLINLWGFDRKGPRDAPPSADEIAEAKRHTGLALLHVDTARDHASLRKDDPALTINLGGIAAGWAVDQLAQLLENSGLHDFMIEVTGEVRARGRSARSQPWHIGVKAPELDSEENIVAVPLENRSLTTSGTYQNFFQTDQRFPHILDAKTGAPVKTDLVSVTVMYPDAVTADGYDTPFIILGEDKARAIVGRMPGMAALFVHQDAAGKLTTTTTTGFPPLTTARNDAVRPRKASAIIAEVSLQELGDAAPSTERERSAWLLLLPVLCALVVAWNVDWRREAS